MDYSTLIEEEEEQRLRRIPLTALYEALKQVKDGRKKRGCRYSLALILTLLLLARLAGETELRAAAQWIRLRKGWIIEQLQLTRKSVPCQERICMRWRGSMRKSCSRWWRGASRGGKPPSDVRTKPVV